MQTLSIAYEYASYLFYLLSGMSFYFCFNLLYIAGVSRYLEVHYSQDYQQKYLDSTQLSRENINFIWRKIHNFGLFGTILISLTFNFILFLPIIFTLFSIYYLSSYSAKLIANSYSKELLVKVCKKNPEYTF